MPKKQRFPLAKIRSHANNNPFQFNSNDYSELSIKTSIESNPKPKHYGERRVSSKNEDKVPRLKQGLKYSGNISKSKRLNDNNDYSKNYILF